MLCTFARNLGLYRRHFTLSWIAAHFIIIYERNCIVYVVCRRKLFGLRLLASPLGVVCPIRGDWWKLIRRSIPRGLALQPIRFLQMKLRWSPITVNASSKHPMSYSSESTMKSSPTHQTRRHSSSPSRACTRRLPGIATLPRAVHGARVRGRTHLVRSHRPRPPLTREKKIVFQSSITS